MRRHCTILNWVFSFVLGGPGPYVDTWFQFEVHACVNVNANVQWLHIHCIISRNRFTLQNSEICWLPIIWTCPDYWRENCSVYSWSIFVLLDASQYMMTLFLNDDTALGQHFLSCEIWPHRTLTSTAPAFIP